MKNILLNILYGVISVKDLTINELVELKAFIEINNKVNKIYLQKLIEDINAEIKLKQTQIVEIEK